MSNVTQKSRREFVGVMAAAATSLLTTSIPGKAIAATPPSPAARYDLLSPDYTERDWEIVDYEFYSLPEIPGIAFRGPRFDPATNAGFATFIGGAQTLGVYAPDPFPAILGRRLGINIWNAAVGGAGPSFFEAQDRILEYANKSRFVVLQMMTARGEGNSRFRPTALVEQLKDLRQGDEVSTQVAWMRAEAEGKERLAGYVEESRQSWMSSNVRLLQQIKVPVILLWFSPKSLQAPLDLAKPRGGYGMLDHFPHFVTGEDLNQLRSLAEGVAVCTSSRNSGHPLISRFSGRPVEVDYAKMGPRAASFKERYNVYYPSPEMQIDAADALETQLRALKL